MYIFITIVSKPSNQQLKVWVREGIKDMGGWAKVIRKGLDKGDFQDYAKASVANDRVCPVIY